MFGKGVGSRGGADVLGADVAGASRLGRNRFLAAAGGALFGLAATMSGKAEPAWAACGSSSPCVVYGLCCCCSGTVCCQSNCVREEHQCGANGCWTTCNGAGNLFQCCDWLSNNYCICRTVIGSC